MATHEVRNEYKPYPGPPYLPPTAYLTAAEKYASSRFDHRGNNSGIRYFQAGWQSSKAQSTWLSVVKLSSVDDSTFM